MAYSLDSRVTMIGELAKWHGIPEAYFEKFTDRALQTWYIKMREGKERRANRALTPKLIPI